MGVGVAFQEQNARFVHRLMPLLPKDFEEGSVWLCLLIVVFVETKSIHRVGEMNKMTWLFVLKYSREISWNNELERWWRDGLRIEIVFWFVIFYVFTDNWIFIANSPEK